MLNAFIDQNFILQTERNQEPNLEQTWPIPHNLPKPYLFKMMFEKWLREFLDLETQEGMLIICVFMQKLVDIQSNMASSLIEHIVYLSTMAIVRADFFFT